MSDTHKNQNTSHLVRAVLALDNHFSELVRLASKIDSLGMKSDSDFEQAERLMQHFAERGEGVATEVAAMSKALNDSRVQAEAAAELVSARAEQLQNRKLDQQKKMEEFRLLGEKVRELTSHISELKRTDDTVLTEAERIQMTERLKKFELLLHPLIEEATSLRKEAHLSKMKILEQNADSLSQSLLAVSKRLASLQ